MNCQDIQNTLNELKVNSKGVIRGQMKVIDKIHSKHLKDLDNQLMDVRIYISKISTGYTTKEALKIIDEFIYSKQIS